MFELMEVKRGLCGSCNRTKTVGRVEAPDGPFFWICPACLDNLSRMISKKADKLYFSWEEAKFMNIYREDMQNLERLFPRLDFKEIVRQVEVEMPRWLWSEEGQKKSKKSNWKAFIVKWLKREELKAVGL
jgi:hypothetical protein